MRRICLNEFHNPTREMAALSDSLTVAILLCLIFGAVAFYIYSRLSQNEKRVGLLENLLLSLKMSTEASLQGPDSVEPVSSPAPLAEEDVDTVEEETYAELLKEIPSASVAPASVAPVTAVADENDAAQLLRSMNLGGSGGSGGSGDADKVQTRKMDANYESMSVKELQALVKQRGMTGVNQRKKELIEALKKGSSSSSSSSAEADSQSAETAAGAAVQGMVEFDGADTGAEGFVIA